MAVGAILIPAIRLRIERFGKLSHDAKSLTGWRLHDAPGLYPAYAPGSQFFKPRNLRLDIVGFNVQVDAAGMIDTLNFDVEALMRIHQLDVLFARFARQDLSRHSQRLAPELSCRSEVIRPAVDNETSQSTFMH